MPSGDSAEGVADNSTNPQTTVRGLGLFVLRYGVVLLLTIVGYLLLVRRLPPSEWGIFSAAQFVLTVAQEVYPRGATVYLIQKRGRPSEKELGTAGALQLAIWLGLVGFAAAACIKLGQDGDSAELPFLMVCASLTCLLYALRSVPVALMERDLNYGHVAIVEVADALCFYSTAIGGVALGFGLRALAIAVILRGLVSTAGAFALRRRLPALSFELNCVIRIYKPSLVFIGTNLASFAFLAVPSLVLGFSAGPDKLAFVQMAFSLFGSALVVTPLVARVTFGAYARMIHETKQSIAVAVDHLVRALSFVTAPILVTFVGSSPWWVPTVMGSGWRPTALVLLLMVPGYMLSGIYWAPVTSALYARHWGKYVFVCQLSILTIYAIAAWFMVPIWKEDGLAVAWTVGAVPPVPFLLFAFRRGYDAPWLNWRALLPPLATCVAAGIWVLINRELYLPALVVWGGFCAWWWMIHSTERRELLSQVLARLTTLRSNRRSLSSVVSVA